MYSIPINSVYFQAHFRIIYVSFTDKEMIPMELDQLQKETVARLRKVKKEQGLTNEKIMEMLEARNIFISEATIKRVFCESNDPTSFKYRDTIAPLADVLLDLYSDKSNSEDVEALKAMIHDKNKTIDILVARDEERRADYERRIAHLQKQIERLEEHLMFRERVVTQKDKIIEKLLSKVIDE